jgi:hypothetical protein
MGGAPQVAMRVTLQIWQIIFASQTLQVFCFCFANPLGFSFGPSQKGTICSSVCPIKRPGPNPWDTSLHTLGLGVLGKNVFKSLRP